MFCVRIECVLQWLRCANWPFLVAVVFVGSEPSVLRGERASGINVYDRTKRKAAREAWRAAAARGPHYKQGCQDVEEQFQTIGTCTRAAVQGVLYKCCKCGKCSAFLPTWMMKGRGDARTPPTLVPCVCVCDCSAARPLLVSIYTYVYILFRYKATLSNAGLIVVCGWVHCVAVLWPNIGIFWFSHIFRQTPGEQQNTPA